MIESSVSLEMQALPSTTLLDRAAMAAPSGSDGVNFVITGAGGSDHWENLRPRHSDSHRARSILEHLSVRMAKMLERLNPIGYRPTYLAGGGSQCKPWIEILSAEIGIKPEITQASPILGAARMALDALL